MSDDPKTAAERQAKLAGPNTLLGRAHDLVEIERVAAELDAADAGPSSFGVARVEIEDGPAAHPTPAPAAGLGPALPIPDALRAPEPAAAAAPVASAPQAAPAPRPPIASASMDLLLAPMHRRAPSAWPRILLAVLAGVLIAGIGLAVFVVTRK
ncbi:MAG: hypothetical protein IT373_35660 [Polyangiaceae bacterium]|nr:hypothetical protein [Polyangiaceae bacterium]